MRLGELQSNYNIQINPEEYANENLKFGLVEVVYEWAKVSYAKTHQFNLSLVLDGL
jgi:superfamily II RNA helicase